MLKILLTFLALTAVVWLGLLTFQKMTGKQVLDLTKNAAYATISVSVAVVLMFILVELF